VDAELLPGVVIQGDAGAQASVETVLDHQLEISMDDDQRLL